MLKNLSTRLSIVKELLNFFWQQKLWWMIPFLLVLLLISILIIFTHSSPIVPFLYTAF